MSLSCIVITFKSELIKAVLYLLGKFKSKTTEEKLKLRMLKQIQNVLLSGKPQKISNTTFEAIVPNPLEQKRLLDLLINEHFLSGRIEDFNAMNLPKGSQYFFFEANVTTSGNAYLKQNERFLNRLKKDKNSK